MKEHLSHLWKLYSIAFAVATGCCCFCNTAQAEIAVKYRDLATGRLAFSLGADGQTRIAVVDFDDRSVYYLPLERSHGEQRAPVWSPDGTELLFTTVTARERQTFKVNCDGTELVQLTKGPGSNDDADWSPDGKRIVFSSSRRGKYRAIYTMDEDGRNQKEYFVGAANFTDPKWSPRGDEMIVGTDSSWPGRDLMLLSLREEKATTLTSGTVSYFDARFDPFGSALAFAAGNVAELDVWIIKRGETRPTRLTSFVGVERSPEWFDDAKQLFYVRTSSNGQSSIHLFDVEKKQDRVVVDYNGKIRELSWTPFFGIRTPEGVPFEDRSE